MNSYPTPELTGADPNVEDWNRFGTLWTVLLFFDL